MSNAKKAEDLKDRAEEKVEDLKSAYQEYKHNLVDYVEKHPITAMAIAAGAGILVSRIWKGMHGNDKS